MACSKYAMPLTDTAIAGGFAAIFVASNLLLSAMSTPIESNGGGGEVDFEFWPGTLFVLAPAAVFAGSAGTGFYWAKECAVYKRGREQSRPK